MAGPARKSDRRFKVAPASEVAGRLLAGTMRKRGFVQAEVVTRWADIVGQELAMSTVPVKLVFPRGERMGATLVVRTESAFAPLLTHKAPHIIEKTNSFFGYGAVAKMTVVQGPLPHKTVYQQLEKTPLKPADKGKLEALTGTGELSPLRQAVKSLGEYVLGRNKKD
nr:DciA family protein [Kordiimonas marina]